MTRRLPAWAHLRAGIVLVALVGHGIYALPIPPPVRPNQLSQPWRQAEIRTWQSQLARVGVQRSTAQLGEALVSVTGLFGRTHRTLKAPFKPVMDLMGTNQAWALFATTTVHPERIIVEVAGEDGEFRIVLRRLDPCCTWMEDQLRYRRLRGAWDSQRDGMRPAYRGLTRWIADRAFEDFPEAQSVRVSVERSTAVYPWEEKIPRRSREFMRTHLRGGP